LSGIIIAGLLAAALSTLSGSMSSMASSVVMDLLKPAGHLSDERALRVSRIMTVVFATVLVGSAVLFMNSSTTVVELALSIASFTYGGLLGTFLLGMLSHRADQRTALIAFAAGILGMVAVISLKLVAWTWFTLAGVTVTVLVGFAVSRLRGTASGA
jgi:Na+/proline symporter